MTEEIQENKNSLPKDWKWVKVGEYVISVKGKKPKRVSNTKTKECSIPYVNIKAFEKNIIDEYTDGIGCALCDDGDFLMVWDGSRSGYVGKAIKGALGSTLVKLNFPDIYNNYAYYFLQSKYLDINTRAKGVGIPHVDPNILWNYDLLIPPKPTQQAIVSKIEELFSELDKGIEQLKTAQQQLKTYRQSVLKWAFEGKLTNGLNYDSFDLHDEHDISIAAEPEAGYKTKKNQGNQNNHINHSSDKGELPEGWKWLKFGELFSESPQNGLYKSTTEYGSGTPIIRIDGFYYGSILDDYEYKRVRLTEEEISRYSISVGDILVNRVNSMPYLGKCGIVKHLKEKTVFESNIMKVRLDKKIALPEYFTMYLSSKKGTTELRKNAKQAVNQASINQTDVSNVMVPLPLIKEQHNIVEAIESRLSVADKMEESISQSLQQAEALRQSILKKAFEGKLINSI